MNSRGQETLRVIVGNPHTRGESDKQRRTGECSQQHQQMNNLHASKLPRHAATPQRLVVHSLQPPTWRKRETAAMTNTEFWSRFESRTSPYNLLEHPFYQAWSRGE